MEKLDLDYFKKKLLEEQVVLEAQLSKLGQKNPDNPEDWEVVPGAPALSQADKNETADRLEDFEERRSTEIQLELRLNNVKKALKKMENGSYGICEKSGNPIERDRLEANPAATTCIKHAE